MAKASKSAAPKKAAAKKSGTKAPAKKSAAGNQDKNLSHDKPCTFEADTSGQ